MIVVQGEMGFVLPETSKGEKFPAIAEYEIYGIEVNFHRRYGILNCICLGLVCFSVANPGEQILK